jgi:hypothetical protein
MFSLLVKKDLLTIPDRKRRDYYKSWYEYIGKDFPDRDNFTAINQHLHYESNKLCFDESDIDYINYSKNFDKRTSKMILS